MYAGLFYYKMSEKKLYHNDTAFLYSNKVIILRILTRYQLLQQNRLHLLRSDP